MKNYTETVQTLKDLFLEYVNNFLTIRGFASYHKIGENRARKLIELGRKKASLNNELKGH